MKIVQIHLIFLIFVIVNKHNFKSDVGMNVTKLSIVFGISRGEVCDNIPLDSCFIVNHSRRIAWFWINWVYRPSRWQFVWFLLVICPQQLHCGRRQWQLAPNTAWLWGLSLNLKFMKNKFKRCRDVSAWQINPRVGLSLTIAEWLQTSCRKVPFSELYAH